ncbi:N-acetyltransferase [Micromonospora sp. BQ11]|uniref:N-acetyltransferase n=1 Tax=Micromonospora sp. BQ11 TaxID=3452212 RepID=UPI003F8B979E
MTSTGTATPGLHIVSLAARPDLASAMLAMESSWPDYIRPDPILVHWAFDRHAAHQLLVLGDDDRVVARAASVPLHWDGDPNTLPDTGWDEALRRCMADTANGRRLTTMCALEIAVVPGLLGRNMSGRVLRALIDHSRKAGCYDLVAPVRPSRKHLEPYVPMREYAARTRPDGLPEDPWLRVHARAGAQILHVCPVSMTVSGSLAQWRRWTGLPFDTSGPTVVPGAVSPVVVDTDQDYAVYIEPNVWVRHRLAERPGTPPDDQTAEDDSDD